MRAVLWEFAMHSNKIGPVVQLDQAFFCTLLKKLNHEKNSKNRVQEKNSAKFCPKTQPTAGFSLLKNYKKNSLYEKNWYFCS